MMMTMMNVVVFKLFSVFSFFFPRKTISLVPTTKCVCSKWTMDMYRLAHTTSSSSQRPMWYHWYSSVVCIFVCASVCGVQVCWPIIGHPTHIVAANVLHDWWWLWLPHLQHSGFQFRWLIAIRSVCCSFLFSLSHVEVAVPLFHILLHWNLYTYRSTINNMGIIGQCARSHIASSSLVIENAMW